MAGLNDVVSPLAGLVMTVEAMPGATLAEGDTVIVLQAMKMEIPVPAEQAGTVEAVLVEEGQEIEMGEVVARLRV